MAVCKINEAIESDREWMEGCRRQSWHPREGCEDSDQVQVLRLKRLKSDLFTIRGVMASPQQEIMTRNANVSPFLRLPPEIRLRIYNFVFGGQDIRIGYRPSAIRIPDKSEPLVTAQHWGSGFHHHTVHGSGRGLDLRLLRVCRHVYTETALLPYALNKFSFPSEDVRKEFQRTARPGKKLVQTKAIGKYEITGIVDSGEYETGVQGTSEMERGWQELGVGGREIKYVQVRDWEDVSVVGTFRTMEEDYLRKKGGLQSRV